MRVIQKHLALSLDFRDIWSTASTEAERWGEIIIKCNKHTPAKALTWNFASTNLANEQCIIVYSDFFLHAFKQRFMARMLQCEQTSCFKSEVWLYVTVWGQTGSFWELTSSTLLALIIHWVCEWMESDPVLLPAQMRCRLALRPWIAMQSVSVSRCTLG